MSKPTAKQLADYLVEHGFSGSIPINEGPKNWRAIKKLTKRDDFYTFGINQINSAVKSRRVNARTVRDVLIKASGLNLKRFSNKGAGYFDPVKSAEALIEGLDRIKQAAKKHDRMIFATGHPGAMLGFMAELAAWAHKQGATLVTINQAVHIRNQYYLDMAGPIFTPSDGCSAWHSHDTAYMQALLDRQTADLVVGDHGFVGAALNNNLPCIGFYDTDDPAMPLAQHLGLPVFAVPMNDNRHNADSSALARFLIAHWG